MERHGLGFVFRVNTKALGELTDVLGGQATHRGVICFVEGDVALEVIFQIQRLRAVVR